MPTNGNCINFKNYILSKTGKNVRKKLGSSDDSRNLTCIKTRRHNWMENICLYWKKVNNFFIYSIPMTVVSRSITRRCTLDAGHIWRFISRKQKYSTIFSPPIYTCPWNNLYITRYRNSSIFDGWLAKHVIIYNILYYVVYYVMYFSAFTLIPREFQIVFSMYTEVIFWISRTNTKKISDTNIRYIIRRII